MSSSRVILIGCIACALSAVIIITAQPTQAACGSCGSAGKKAVKHTHALSAGTGYSELTDATKAGLEAANKAKKAIGKITPKLVLVFGLARNFDQAKALAAVTSVFDSGIVHGTAGYNSISEEGNAGTISVLALGGDKLGVTPVIADVTNKDFEACGKKIGKRLSYPSKVHHSGKVVILLGDCWATATCRPMTKS
ncbi:MAG: hypothetical protein QGH94_00125 [Phycisphaerae bacterium]|nr:hypothetical protein [Phycisphaerae bacterium]